MESILPVSLVVTTLNEEKSIGAFLASVARQTRLPRQIVVCDGGSTDSTVDILRSSNVEGTSIHVIELRGGNIAQGRNAAITAASCDILAVSDAGCILEVDWLERITAPLLTDETCRVVGGGYTLRTETPFEHAAAAAELRVEDLDPSAFLPSSRSIAFRRQAWLDVGMYPEALTFAGEDTAFCLALQEFGHTIRLELGARVAWKPRANLPSYLRQHYLYGVGDGEARNKGTFYAKIPVKYGALALLLVLSAFNILIFLASALLVIVYISRLYRLYHWNEVPVGIRARALILLLVKEMSLLAGYISGRVRKRRIATTSGF